MGGHSDMVLVYLSKVEWDEGNQEKCQKHGVSLDEIEELLRGRTAKVLSDKNHSEFEKRYIAVGKTLEGKYLFIAFTLRSNSGEVFIRPISARYMHAKEIERYEKANS